MAVTHDGTADVGGSCTAALTLTITGKTTAGANRCGVVSVGWTNETPVISGATWNGVAMTIVEQGAETAQISLGAGLLVIVDPPTGAADIVITFDAAATAQAMAYSFTGVDQATPVSAENEVITTGTTPSPVTITVATAADEVVVDAVSWSHFDTVAASVGANQISVMNAVQATYYFALASYQLGSDGGVMSWTLPGDASWITIAASLKAAAGGGGNLSVQLGEPVVGGSVF